MILDAAAAEMIEKYLDAEEEKVLADPALAGLTMNRRFSPGYGDLPLSVQKGFLAALDAERTVGIHLTATNLMVPRKSVTAFMAAYRDPQDVKFKRRPA
jgi:cobalamin-dependent methionine synthase I